MWRAISELQREMPPFWNNAQDWTPANKIRTILTIFLVLLDVAVFRNHVFIQGNLQIVIYRVLCSYKLDVLLFASTTCNVFILTFFPYFSCIRIFEFFIFPPKVSWHNRHESSHKKESRAERSGDIGSHSVCSWPPIHLLVIISFNHWLIIRQNMEVPILLKPDTWQHCWVGLQHLENSASFRIYSGMRKDGPDNVVLRMPRQTIFFALFWLHLIHWGGWGWWGWGVVFFRS
jgi:hypothetical protein